jgi:hypothetical protein
MRRPVRIAGGGLAGLSLGVALARRGVEVELHEALAYPRHRVCGEFVSGVSSGTLESLGISEALDPGVRIRRARWNDLNGCVAEMEVDGIGISRWVLDERLRCEFESAGGVLKTGSRIVAGEGTVWAAGRPRTKGKWIGLKCHFCGLELASGLEMFASPGGYIGLARIEGGAVNACGLFRADAVRDAKGVELLFRILEECGLSDLSGRLRGAEPVPGSLCGVAGFRLGAQSGPEFSIGDAAAMIPPFTGNGMTMAFESAECALFPCLDYAEGKMNWLPAAQACRDAQRRRFRRRMVTAMVLHFLLVRPIALRGAFALARRRCIPFQSLLQLVR